VNANKKGTTMSVKLLLNPAAEAKAFTHPETGITFHIRLVTPAEHEAIRAASRNKSSGVLDVSKWGENYAVKAIADWGDEVGDKTGPLPCNEANLRIFGRQQAVNIIPWIAEQATSLEQFRIEEETAAKNG
jgi:hypothetical protein